MMKSPKKVIRRIILIVVMFCALGVYTYTNVLPYLVSNEKVISYAEDKLNKTLGLDINIENPCLKTNLNPDIAFSVGLIDIKKDNQQWLLVKDLDTEISLSQAKNKKIIVKKFGADEIFADVNKLMSLSNGEQKDQQKNDWSVDLFDSVLYLNKSFIIYNVTPETRVELKADNLSVDNTEKIQRFVHFDFDADIIKSGKTVHVAFADDNKIIIGNKKLLVKDCPLTINHSQMFFDAEASREKGYELEIYAKRFFIPDVIKLLQTNIIENNINDVLCMFQTINGDFDFNIKLTKKDISGNIKLNRLSSKLIALNNLPFLINSGDIKLSNNDLKFSNFKGYYNNKKSNEFEFEGTVNDYLNTMKSHFDVISTISTDLMHDYLAKTAGMNMKLTGDTRAKILVDTFKNDIDVVLMGKIPAGKDILVNNASFSPVNYDRAYKADMSIRGDKLTINTINYYIAKELTRASKGIQPILTFKGNTRLSDGFLYDFGFDIPKPLPSEFLNVLIGQKIFKKGQFSGKLEYDNNGKYPKLNGNLQAEKIRIPSQRLSIRKGNIVTVGDGIKVTAEGRFKRANYTFSGDILNKMLFPIIVRNTNLTIDNVDVERILNSANAPVQTAEQAEQAFEKEEEKIEEDVQTFDIRNIIIQDCIVKILKGNYKEIDFSNIEAKMSLDKDGIFRMKSNRFDIAEGISSLDVNCDLINLKYAVKLGIKDVNADTMSTVLLNLPREITGKASGLLDLNMDETLKLNGTMKFIIKDGTIQKVGLVEYALKFASLFRNPIAMISPSTIVDLVNVPEGNFEKITGDMRLKDNRVELMKIKSYSSQLSAYIVGCYNIENSDAILRIYTKFSNKNKGFAGFLRNISLNSLSNRVHSRSRSDENYYSAELAQLPPIDADEKDCQIFVTKVDGDVEHYNFLSSLKKIK